MAWGPWRKERPSIDDQVAEEWTTWLEQKALRVERGDDLTIERQVEHVLYFRRRRHARRAQIIINRSRSVRLTEFKGHPWFMLEAITPDDLRDETVLHSLRFLITVAEMCHGTYDGFGAMVVEAS